ncbi:carbamate kinase [Enterococcus sp. AZ163]|uniref:carbamate kinase n=1 Tax=Enterococcus sp. AZ163 TaxID=2774638 RepID=UPI003D274D44
METVVVALGGNALGNTPQEQLKLVGKTAEIIFAIAKQDVKIAVGHGNGPQVGMINSAFEREKQGTAMPFPECDAMSQGYIGYHLQQAIKNQLDAEKVKRNCMAIITQVVVSTHDPAFQQPTKPIGEFLSREAAETISKETGFRFVEDSGRGYRRVVPSPLPIDIVEIDTVKQLVDESAIVITVGGGGIPVVKTEKGYQGIAAVIDKDRSCAKLAIELSAETLLILTAVDQVYLHFNKPHQEALGQVSVEEVRSYVKAGHFAAGSMLPKIEAAISYVEATGGRAIITSLEKAEAALKGGTATIITP